MQGTCVNFGDCEIGCKVDAKNHLALNYVPIAEKNGAEVRPLHLVTNIECDGTGYRVHYKRIIETSPSKKPRIGFETGSIVIVAAGSIGSTELLLRCRDETCTLPHLSHQLGQKWNNNGFLFIPAFLRDELPPGPTFGPTISSALDFLDGSQDDQPFWLEDGGFPSPLIDHFLKWVAHEPKGRFQNLARQTALDCIEHLLTIESLTPRRRKVKGKARLHPKSLHVKRMIPFFVQGIDKNNGSIWLRDGKLKLAWDLKSRIHLSRRF